MEQLDPRPEAVKFRLQKFTEDTGWHVKDEYLICWHVAVGRKNCKDTQCAYRLRNIELLSGGPADFWHTLPLDHPRRAWTPNGECALLCSPYVLDQRGASALSEWCRENDLTWTAVPAGWYWPGITLSVVIRNSNKEPQSPVDWIPDPIRWERWK